MATIFISHSSKDEAPTRALEAWLKANGFTDYFVDYSSIEAGAKWADALAAAAGACRVVLCLITESWLGSSECPSEFRAAAYMGKRIIPLFLLRQDEPRSDANRHSPQGRHLVVPAVRASRT